MIDWKKEDLLTAEIERRELAERKLAKATDNLARLDAEIKIKGGDELSLAQWAYDQACVALDRHRKRADKAEKALAKAMEALERLAGPPENNADVNEGRIYAVAQAALARIKEMGE